jgi:hypothetical protein
VKEIMYKEDIKTVPNRTDHSKDAIENAIDKRKKNIKVK